MLFDLYLSYCLANVKLYLRYATTITTAGTTQKIIELKATS